MHDPADYAPVICSFDAAHIRRQMRLNPCPLLIAQPEQISAHHPFPNTNQYRIVEPERLIVLSLVAVEPQVLDLLIYLVQNGEPRRDQG